ESRWSITRFGFDRQPISSAGGGLGGPGRRGAGGRGNGNGLANNWAAGDGLCRQSIGCNHDVEGVGKYDHFGDVRIGVAPGVGRTAAARQVGSVGSSGEIDGLSSVECHARERLSSAAAKQAAIQDFGSGRVELDDKGIGCAAPFVLEWRRGGEV